MIMQDGMLVKVPHKPQPEIDGMCWEDGMTQHCGKWARITNVSGIWIQITIDGGSYGWACKWFTEHVPLSGSFNISRFG